MTIRLSLVHVLISLVMQKFTKRPYEVKSSANSTYFLSRSFFRLSCRLGNLEIVLIAEDCIIPRLICVSSFLPLVHKVQT